MHWLLNPRILIALALAAVLAFAGWKLYRAGGDAVRVEWAAERERMAAEVAAQAERNRELQRAAEKRYVVQAGMRDRFIVKTVTEVRYAAAPMASCPVPAAARSMLNAAAACARGDSAASCGADQPVPAAR
jgi:hypothetical protein